ncbi:MAG: hypothetical protein ACRD3Y_11665, partial [Bryobacteraceae bacterium]
MFQHRFFCLLFASLLASPAALFGFVAAKPAPTPAEIQNIITKFTQKETEFAKARQNYTWTQSTKMDEVDPPGGSYYLIEDVGFND